MNNNYRKHRSRYLLVRPRPPSARYRARLCLIFIPPLERRVEDAEGGGEERSMLWSVWESEERDLLDVSILSAQEKEEEGPHVRAHNKDQRRA